MPTHTRKQRKEREMGNMKSLGRGNWAFLLGEVRPPHGEKAVWSEIRVDARMSAAPAILSAPSVMGGFGESLTGGD